MEIITQASETVLKILSRFAKAEPCIRLIKYCAQVQADTGVLLFNLLTREMVLLSAEEYANMTSLEYLKEHWFLVPEQTNEQELADLVRWVLVSLKKKNNRITGYTIFTTTDCNARCFYCFEKGRTRTPMSEETALRVVQYIKAHCGGEAVKLNWFGGEPLYNMTVIDTICDGLCREGIKYRSNMVSNGYLFDDEVIQRAIECWNLRHVQITLDGTEKIYNRTKAYIYRDGSPYQVVMNNIERLLDASIAVSIRLNMDLYNADNLQQLIDELAQRFDGRAGLTIYVHHLFKVDQPMAELYSDEEWEARDCAMQRLMDRITQYGLTIPRGIAKRLRIHHCMADSGEAVTIMPGGEIGLCEHYSESEFIGHIDREGFDEAVVASWKETVPALPECADCFCYPTCWRLQKCVNSRVCFRQLRQERLRRTEQEMITEYRRWKAQVVQEETEESEQC